MLKDMEAKAGDPGGVALEAERLTKALVSLEKNAAFWAHHAMVGQVRSVLKDVGRVIADRVTGRADAALSDAFAVELDEAEQDNAGDEERILERLEITESHALTLQRCARIADSTGFGVEVGTQIADVCRRIQQRAGGGGASDARGDRFLRAVRLTELVAGAEAAQQLLAKAPRFLMSTALGPDTSTTYAIDGADDGSPGQPETRDMELERFMRHISLADA